MHDHRNARRISRTRAAPPAKRARSKENQSPKRAVQEKKNKGGAITLLYARNLSDRRLAEELVDHSRLRALEGRKFRSLHRMIQAAMRRAVTRPVVYYTDGRRVYCYIGSAETPPNRMLSRIAIVGPYKPEEGASLFVEGRERP